MDNLRAELDKLEDRQLAYVAARSKTVSDSQAMKDCGLSRSTFYGWGEEEREKLNGIAMVIKREVAFRALMVLQDHAEEAADVTVGLLKSRNENIKLRTSQDILDRVIGKATQTLEVSGKDGNPMKIEVEYVNAPYPDAGVSSGTGDNRSESE
jgi:ACT domain-containing protein